MAAGLAGAQALAGSGEAHLAGRILWLKCNVGLRILVRTGARETEIRPISPSLLDGRTKNLDLIQQVMRSQENLQTCKAIMANVLA